MQRYILRRLLLLIPTLLVVSVVIFGMVRAVPGDVVSILLGEGQQDPADRAEMEQKLGLDGPLHVQYFRWLGNVAQGDLGESIFTGKDVKQDLREKFEITAVLAIESSVIAMLIAFPIGILATIRQDTIIDYAARSFGLLGLSLPNFWVATMVVVYGSIHLGYAPPLRYADASSEPVKLMRELLVPALVLGWILSGTLLRMIRTSLLDVLRQDYIRTAWAKGMRERVIVARHALKNAMIPVITVIGIQLASLLGGAIIIESVFNIPGVGRLMVESVALRDYPVIQGITLAITLLVLVTNLLVDLSYGYLDPRIRYT